MLIDINAAIRGVGLSGGKNFPDRLDPIDGEGFARVHARGFNAIRLLVFWETLEPQRGRYDARYLARISAQVDAARAAGLAVLIDFHQDVFGEGFDSAGFPSWVGDSALYDRFQPSPAWYCDYFNPNVMRCFDEFWNSPDRIDSLARALAHTAAALKGRVIGYELINEPFWGSEAPAEFEASVLPAVYARCIAAIREVDQGALAFVSPAPWVNLGFPSRLERPIEGAGLVYAPHFYPPAIELGGYYDGDPSPLRRQLEGLLEDASRLRMPLAITEYGVRRNAVRGGQFVNDLRALIRAFDIASFYWDLGPSDDAGYGLLDLAGKWTEIATHAVDIPRPLAVR